MLHVKLPLANILVAIWEVHCALSVFFATFKVSIVPTTVFELKFALSFEHILLELTFVRLFTLREVVDSYKINR